MPGAPEQALQKHPHSGRSGLTREDSKAHDPARAVIDGHGKPPAEGPDLRQGEGYPRSPESERRGHGGEIDVPEVIRFSGGDGARGRLKTRAGFRRSCLPQHSAHRRRGEVETRAGEDLGDLDLAQGGAENFEAPHEVADEVGELVHRFGQTDESSRSFLVETPHPGGDGEGSDEEYSGGLGEGP